ncbi:GNAT family N-acetyltransferase [Lysinibacillus sp. NPDC097195]|uniref:GNAT family N-acetyltransferase n=1 Tax=Lysinibacillus sp. NPDC097195 TaxID=3364141 RepID=UPI003810590D
MNIRTANIHDIKALSLLMEHLGYPTTEEQMTVRFQALAAHPSYHTLVAEMDGHVVGMAGLCHSLFYEHDGCYVRIQAFVVDDHYRRKGIGQKLLEAIECWAVEQGASAIVLNSGNREERNAAHQFYKQHGFEGKSTGFSKQLNRGLMT